MRPFVESSCSQYCDLYVVNRGPNKRQIKPVENSPLLQFVLGEDEDEDEDEDFDFDEHAEGTVNSLLCYDLC